MYETLAAGTVNRTVTTQDLNIPDPPAGADPQMAAGFNAGAVARASSPAAPGTANIARAILNPATSIPLASAVGPWSVIRGPSPTVSVPTISQASPEPTLVTQDLDHETLRERLLTTPDTGRVLDAALADLVTRADPALNVEVGGTSGVQRLPGTRHVEDGTTPKRIPTDRIDPAEFARPVELPHHNRPVKHGFIRKDSPPDALLDDLAADAVGFPGRLPIAVDAITRSEIMPERGEGLAKLAAILVVAGSWGYRAHFRGVTSWPAGTPRYRKESELFLARRRSGTHGGPPRQAIRPDRGAGDSTRHPSPGESHLNSRPDPQQRAAIFRHGCLASIVALRKALFPVYGRARLPQRRSSATLSELTVAFVLSCSRVN
jgi:hypothetical protein